MRGWRPRGPGPPSSPPPPPSPLPGGGGIKVDISPWRQVGSETEIIFVGKQPQRVSPHLDHGVPHDVPDGLAGHGGDERLSISLIPAEMSLSVWPSSPFSP